MHVLRLLLHPLPLSCIGESKGETQGEGELRWGWELRERCSLGYVVGHGVPGVAHVGLLVLNPKADKRRRGLGEILYCEAHFSV